MRKKVVKLSSDEKNEVGSEEKRPHEEIEKGCEEMVLLIFMIVAQADTNERYICILHMIQKRKYQELMSLADPTDQPRPWSPLATFISSIAYGNQACE